MAAPSKIFLSSQRFICQLDKTSTTGTRPWNKTKVIYSYKHIFWLYYFYAPIVFFFVFCIYQSFSHHKSYNIDDG